MKIAVAVTAMGLALNAWLHTDRGIDPDPPTPAPNACLVFRAGGAAYHSPTGEVVSVVSTQGRMARVAIYGGVSDVRCVDMRPQSNSFSKIPGDDWVEGHR